MPTADAAALVYVVDDDIAVLGSLRFLLETEGFAVRTFRSAAPLLDAIDEGQADCIVLDYKMPNMNGIDLAKRLRERLIASPVVLITGYPDASIETRAAEAGVRHVVLKPHLEESLLWHIRCAMQETALPQPRPV